MSTCDLSPRLSARSNLRNQMVPAFFLRSIPKDNPQFEARRQLSRIQHFLESHTICNQNALEKSYVDTSRQYSTTMLRSTYRLKNYSAQIRSYAALNTAGTKAAEWYSALLQRINVEPKRQLKSLAQALLISLSSILSVSSWSKLPAQSVK
jgi:hypothetical protein